MRSRQYTTGNKPFKTPKMQLYIFFISIILQLRFLSFVAVKDMFMKGKEILQKGCRASLPEGSPLVTTSLGKQCILTHATGPYIPNKKNTKCKSSLLF